MSKEVIVILIIVVLLFGATALPKLARSLGEASREFKNAVGERGGEEAPKANQSPPAAPTPPSPAPPAAASVPATPPTTPPTPATPPTTSPIQDPNELVTMSRAELDALLAERERNASKDVPPPAQG